MRPEERLDVVSRSTSEDGSTVGWLRSDMMIQYGGFHTWGYPNSWMVFVRENPIYKWMMTGGTPILGNPHIAKPQKDARCFQDGSLMIFKHHNFNLSSFSSAIF
jgi:hypothetical protein